ncbi:Ger(x)C family spore germination protein [Sporomusa sp. KB1]|jgi:spore germination protein KC|uniref:Ger(x)C family spore germination protein n=1 Tax=Sporomusa sp. KB1 TaxID=943346 RepID=UPI00119EAF97|nr:Ger(x)C family spore germination protein [Sporomusa sp. KB1]TWH45845.1 spore germination protein KC [Sporomusa sp. KB1]
MLNKIKQENVATIAWRSVAVGIGICACLLTTGCWDAKEMQDRNFVLIAAIDDADIVKKSESEKHIAQTQTFVQKQGTKEYMLSLQILKLVKSESKGGGTQGEKTFVISDTGKPMFEMVRDMLGQSSKSIYFEHLSAIVISEAAVKKNGLRPILDFFRRDPEMRSRTKIFITPGEAKAIAQYNPPTGEPGGTYLNGLIRNHRKNVHVAGSKADIGYITQAMDNDADYTIPRLDYIDNLPKLGGLALFKHDTLMGYADEYITRGFKFMYGTEKSAVIPVKCSDDPEQEIVYELFQHDTKLTPHIEGDTIYFTLDVTMQGNLGESNCKTKHDMHDLAFLHSVEQEVAQEVAQNVRDTWKFQQQLGVDIPNVKARFKGYHPFEWKKIKDQWEDIYPTIPLIISVNVSIRGVGEHD